MKAHTRLDNLQGGLAGTHWDVLRELLPTYRKITRVDVGNGRNTSFWGDIWLGDCPLVDSLPTLHSHCIEQEKSVQEMMTGPLCSHFQLRLSRQAEGELQKLQLVLQEVSLTNADDG